MSVLLLFALSVEICEFSCEVFEWLCLISSSSLAICSGSKCPFVWDGDVRVVAPRGVREL